MASRNSVDTSMAFSAGLVWPHAGCKLRMLGRHHLTLVWYLPARVISDMYAVPGIYYYGGP